jgi:hypothetical protein
VAADPRPDHTTTRRWSDCPECRDFYTENYDAVVFASASIGIEHGLTTNRALAIYMAARHTDHADDDDSPLSAVSREEEE